jgi:hypothetical protein
VYVQVVFPPLWITQRILVFGFFALSVCFCPWLPPGDVAPLAPSPTPVGSLAVLGSGASMGGSNAALGIAEPAIVPEERLEETSASSSWALDASDACAAGASSSALHAPTRTAIDIRCI